VASGVRRDFCGAREREEEHPDFMFMLNFLPANKETV
jgi:hypothetical protein